MKSRVLKRVAGRISVVLALALLPVVNGQTTNLINDGTTIASLVRLQNQSGLGTPPASLVLTPAGGELEASQSPDYTDSPLNGVWYDNRYVAASGSYLVQVDARPAAGYPEHVLGVMGWLDPAAGKGLAFRILPGSPAPFQVATIDFQAATWEGNDSVADLYELDGTPAVAGPGSAWAQGGDYSPDLAATLSLRVAPPTPAELAAVPNATARLTARVHQGAGVQVGDTVELVTTLAVPASHRFGYFAGWGTSILGGELIGYLDNLRFVGDLKLLPPSEPPRLENPQALPSTAAFREFTFRATGLGGGSYRLETTTNFANWSPVATGAITGPSMDFTFARSTTGHSLMYRLVVLP